MTVLRRLFPSAFGDRYQGRLAALWLLGLFLALKLIMSVNSILNTEAVATGADGFLLGSYGADGSAAVLMLFALGAVDQLMLTVLGFATLIRYRAMVPCVFLLLLADQVGRRLVIESYEISRAPGGGGVSYFMLGLLAVLVVGLVLSLLGRGADGSHVQQRV